MGWTYMEGPRPKGMSDAEFFTKECLAPYQEFVATATVGTTFYAAMRYGWDAPNFAGEVVGVVILLDRGFGKRFGWKSMDETMGPNESSAPAKVLDALTPTTERYALEWRERCRAELVKVAAAKKVKAGTQIEFPAALNFGNGMTSRRFIFLERNIFRIDVNGPRVRIPGWKRMAFTTI